ncbi:MAG: hypothetical protein V1880_04535 [Patescibacteria group bacterium]
MKSKKTAMEPFEHILKMGRKSYKYSITPINRKEIYFECKAAGIAQKFLAEDIPNLLVELPDLILSEIEFNKTYNQMIRFRITSEEKRQIQKNAVKNGYNNISAFIRDLALKV